VLAWYKVDNIITWNLTYSLHDIADKLLIFGVKQQSHTHSLLVRCTFLYIISFYNHLLAGTIIFYTFKTQSNSLCDVFGECRAFLSVKTYGVDVHVRGYKLLLLLFRCPFPAPHIFSIWNTCCPMSSLISR